MSENSQPKVLMIITRDTKDVEAQFIRSVLEEKGVDVIHLDASIRSSVEHPAEIPPEKIAEAAGDTIEGIRALNHEGKCQAKMVEGSIKIAQGLAEQISGVIAVGGSMGTTLGTAVMQTLPYGMPKVMVSTMASGFTKPFIGSKDIIMVNPVCDIAGLNSITRDVFRHAAVSLAAMAKDYHPVKAEPKPLVAMTTLSTTDRATVRIRQQLEKEGYEVMVFHTLGTGGMAMDDIVRERDVCAVVDLSLIEIGDFLHGGLAAAGPDRAKAGIRKGVPTVFAPGNIDFLVAGPLEVARQQFPGKRYHLHNAALTAVRTEIPEMTDVANYLADAVKDASGDVWFYVPLKGFSHHDSPDGYLHDLDMPPQFAEILREALSEQAPPHVKTQIFDCHINDPEFADAIVQTVLQATRPQAGAGA